MISNFQYNTFPKFQTFAQAVPNVLPFFAQNYLIQPCEFGFIQVNVLTGFWGIRPGIAKHNPPLWPPAVASMRIVGDCWQTVGNIAGNDGWVVAPNMAHMCEFAAPYDGSKDCWGLQVWKGTPNGFNWYGYIRGRANGETRLDGDMAYVRQPGSVVRWMQFDLNELLVTGANLPDAPPFQNKMTFLGNYYDLTFSKSNPQYPGPNLISGVLHGGAVLPTFCPKDFVSRQQVAAMIYNAVNWMVANPGQKLVPPPDQQFVDVPMTSEFAPAINAMKVAGLIAGKSPCEAPEP